uniref:Uncharacterized protein n=1 Tax=Ciona intestinalis TaxID=7719 RepID=F6QD52_CIOIN
MGQLTILLLVVIVMIIVIAPTGTAQSSMPRYCTRLCKRNRYTGNYMKQVCKRKDRQKCYICRSAYKCGAIYDRIFRSPEVEPLNRKKIFQPIRQD